MTPLKQQPVLLPLRVPEDIRAWLKRRAEKNNRSVNKEVLHVLQQLREKEAA